MIIPIAAIDQARRDDYRKRFGKGDTALLDALQERCEGELDKLVLEAKHRGIDFRLKLDDKESVYHLSVPCRGSGRFKLRRKTRFDRFMANIVPGWAIHSRDPRFDAAYTISTQDLRPTEQLVGQREMRDAVDALMSVKAGALTMEEGRLRLTGTRKSLVKHADVNTVLTLVRELGRIADSATRWASRRERTVHPRFDPATTTVASILGLFGVAGLAMLIVGITEYPLVNPSSYLPVGFASSFAVLLVVIFPVVLALSRRTSPYRLVTTYSLLTLIAVSLFVNGALLVSNGRLDRGVRVVEVEPVCCKVIRGKDKKKKYYVGIHRDLSVEPIRWFPVFSSTFERVREEQQGVSFRTAPGALSFRWLESYQVVDL
jgi:hypothetical protein